MCVICVKLRGKVIPAQYLERMFEAEPHGAGFAVSLGRKVFFRKGFMEFGKFMDQFRRWNAEDYLVVVHFRMASVGQVVPELTHPFPLEHHRKKLLVLEGEAEMVLFHNGTLVEWREDGLSDTATLAKFLGKLRGSYGVKVQDLIKLIKGVGRFDKFVLQTPRRVYLIGDFRKKDGLYFSNLGWEVRHESYMDCWKKGWLGRGWNNV